MSELIYKRGSIVVPEEQALECAAMADNVLKELALGQTDLSLTYAARREIFIRVIPKVAAEITLRSS